MERNSHNSHNVVIRIEEKHHGKTVGGYEVNGMQLPNGWLLTRGTGVDGRDSLWESIEDFIPTGGDYVIDHSIGEPVPHPTAEEVWEAAADNRDGSPTPTREQIRDILWSDTRVQYLLGEGGPTRRNGEPAELVEDAELREDWVELVLDLVPPGERWFVVAGSKTARIYDE